MPGDVLLTVGAKAEDWFVLGLGFFLGVQRISD